MGESSLSVGATVMKEEPTTSTDPSTDNVIGGLRRAHRDAPTSPTISMPAAIHKLTARPDLTLADMLCSPILPGSPTAAALRREY
jgi:hypothetical protein